MTEFEEARFRELAGRVMAGTCSEAERGEVEVGLLGGGRAAEVFAEEARAAVVTEMFFVGERKRGEVFGQIGQRAVATKRRWRWAVAAALVGLIGLTGIMWDTGGDAGVADGGGNEVGPPVIAAEDAVVEPLVGPAVEIGESPVGEAEPDGGDEVRGVLARFFLPEVELDDVPLGEALATLGEALRAYNVNGRESLETLVLGAGRGLEGRRVTLKTRGVPFLTVLRSLAAQVGGEVVVDPPAVALVAGDGAGQGLLTKMYAGAGELVGRDEQARAELLGQWGGPDDVGGAPVTPDGGLLLRGPVEKLAAAEVMLEELRRRQEEPLTLEIIRVVVDDPAVGGGEQRVETRAEVERLAEGRGAEVSREVVSWQDQEPVIVGGGGDEVEEGGDGERSGEGEGGGVPLTLFAGLEGELTLIPVRMGESIAVVSESSGFDAVGESVFLDGDSMFSLGALSGLSGLSRLSGADGRALFFVGVSEGDRGGETEAEAEAGGEEP